MIDPNMPRAVDVAQTAIRLIEVGNHTSALQVLKRKIDRVQSYSDWQELRTAFDCLPGELLFGLEWASSYTRVLVGFRDSARLLQFCQDFLKRHSLPHIADVLVDYAWALYAIGRFAEARESLEQALPYLQGIRLGVAWRRLGLVRFEIGEDWQDGFIHARSLLSGRLLGIALLDEGGCWYRVGQGSKARSVWLEALPEFAKDPFHMAWALYNLGDSAQRDGLPEAEQYFMEAERLTRRKAAKAFRARALQGLGTFYRTRGEWPRAEAAYLEAIRSAVENDDRYVGYWSLGRCYRLMGEPSKAIEAISRALEIAGGSSKPIFIEQAAILLASKHALRATEAINCCPQPRGNHRYLADILKAELARQEGNTNRVVELLTGIPGDVLVACEEARCWPELFELGRQAGLNPPQPLDYPTRLTVQVQALGPLRVSVNNRPVAIDPTSRAGELLVLLLENRGKAQSMYLIACLWPGSNPKQKYQALWQLVREIRILLGWPGSVDAIRGKFKLDPNVVWEYDVDKARRTGVTCSNFLEGVHSGWAREVARELEALMSHKKIMG